VVTLDAPSFAAVSGNPAPGGESDPQQVRALRHTLAEYDIATYPLRAGSRLSEVLSR
jgi:hypothetical protein